MILWTLFKNIKKLQSYRLHVRIRTKPNGKTTTLKQKDGKREETDEWCIEYTYSYTDGEINYEVKINAQRSDPFVQHILQTNVFFNLKIICNECLLIFRSLSKKNCEFFLVFSLLASASNLIYHVTQIQIIHSRRKN